MSERDDQWNPEDGPPPDEDERREAHALADALAGAPGALERGADPDLDDLLDVALRVRATAHPSAERTRHVAHSAVEAALTRAGQRWYHQRWRWMAIAAAAVMGVGGVQLLISRPIRDDGPPPVTRSASDVFSAPLGEHEGSGPIDRITEARMRAYRDNLLYVPTARRTR